MIATTVDIKAISVDFLINSPTYFEINIIGLGA